MSDSLRQDQRAGDYSTNVQAQTVEIHRHGVTAAEARQIALDVFKSNAIELAGIAKDLFEARGREFIDRYLEELQRRNPAGLDSFSDPDILVAVYTAQREYARTGQLPQGEVLVNLMVDRVQADAEALSRIALDEAISSAARLTMRQWSALSFLFFVGVGKDRSVKTVSDLAAFLNESVAPFARESSENAIDFHHLESVGCIVADRTMGSTFPERIAIEYPKHFTFGFSVEDCEATVPGGQDSEWVQLASRRRSTYEFRFLDAVELREAFKDRRYDEIKKLEGLLYKNLLPPEQVKAELESVVPDFDLMARLWERVQRMSLTPAGIAIALANIRRQTGLEFDLSYWIK